MMNKIGTALLSFGMSGRVFHAPFLHLHAGFELLGAWERSSKIVAEKYAGVKSYNTLEEVLEDDQVELVVVNTPTYTHFEYAEKALRAGKHVVVEKAFVGTQAEAEHIRDLAAELGLKAMVFQNRRWDSDFTTVKSVIDSGRLGDLVEVRIAFDRYRPLLSAKAHKEKPSNGAGIIKDLGAHVIDQAFHLFGRPNRVFADIGVTRVHSEVDDYFDILLSYGQLRVHVHGGYFFLKPTPEYALHGTKGTFLKSRADVQEDQLQAGVTPDAASYGVEPGSAQGKLYLQEDKSIETREIPTIRGNYMAFYDAVFSCIREGGLEPVSASEGVEVMRIIEAAFQSAAEGRVIDL